MKKLLLVLIIVASAQSLHGMEPEREQLSPISLPQTYRQLAEFLTSDVTRYIFSLHLGDIDLSKLPLEIEQSCKDPRKLVLRINTLIKSCGHSLSVELFKKYFPHEKTSICDIKNSEGRTVLHFAACGSNTEIVKLLLDMAGDNAWTLLTRQTVYGNTALHRAADHGHIEIAKLLLDTAGHNAWTLLTMQNHYGGTALHCAAGNGRTEITKLLLNAAGDKVQDFIAMKTNDEKTAFDFADPAAREVIKQYMQSNNQ